MIAGVAIFIIGLILLIVALNMRRRRKYDDDYDDDYDYEDDQEEDIENDEDDYLEPPTVRKNRRMTKREEAYYDDFRAPAKVSEEPYYEEEDYSEEEPDEEYLEEDDFLGTGSLLDDGELDEFGADFDDEDFNPYDNEDDLTDGKNDRSGYIPRH